MQETLKRSGDDDKKIIQELLDKTELSEGDIEKLKQYILQSGAKDKTEQLIDQFAKEAYTIIENLTFTDESKQRFKTLVAAATKRSA